MLENILNDVILPIIHWNYWTSITAWLSDILAIFPLRFSSLRTSLQSWIALKVPLHLVHTTRSPVYPLLSRRSIKAPFYGRVIYIFERTVRFLGQTTKAVYFATLKMGISPKIKQTYFSHLHTQVLNVLLLSPPFPPATHQLLKVKPLCDNRMYYV